MTEPQAIESGMRFHINRGVMTGRRAESDRSRLSTKFSLNATSRIPDAHLFGHNAAKAINIFALAIKFGLNTHDLKKVLWVYPTHIFDVKYMLDSWVSICSALDGFFRSFGAGFRP